MDRLKLIEIIAKALRERSLSPSRITIDSEDDGYVAGTIADAIIREIGLRSLRTGGSAPEGGTMPPGPWTGTP